MPTMSIPRSASRIAIRPVPTANSKARPPPQLSEEVDRWPDHLRRTLSATSWSSVCAVTSSETSLCTAPGSHNGDRIQLEVLPLTMWQRSAGRPGTQINIADERRYSLRNRHGHRYDAQSSSHHGAWKRMGGRNAPPVMTRLWTPVTRPLGDGSVLQNGSMHESSATIAYITGASRGIGRLLATSLADSGARVVGFARPSEDLESLGDLSTPVLSVATDVSDPDSVSSAFAKAVDAIGPPTLLVTCAGSTDALGPIATVDPERWWQAVTVDLRGTMLCTRAAMPLMVDRGAGRIVTVYGNLGDDGREHVSAFAAAKAAIARFTETLATELDGTGVVAICIHPGFVRTPMTEHLAHSAEGTQWLPSFGEHAEDHWGDGTPAVDLIHRITAGRADPLAGRVIHVGDDLEALTKTCLADLNERRLRLRR